jgi:purine-nucleoside phosphorylase
MLFPELRIASRRDIPELLRMERECFECPWDSGDLETCIGRGGSSPVRTWLALITGETAGSVTAALDAEGVHLVSLGVRQAFRRRGLGSLLAGIAEGWGARLGARMCRLEYRASSVPAGGLYSSLGYTFRGMSGDYYPDGESARIMKKKLDPDLRRTFIAAEIVTRWGGLPPVGVVLGSGLSWLAEAYPAGPSISYASLPGFGHLDLAGHPGELRLSGCGRFVFLMGRRHGYQGFDGDEITLLPGILADLGVTTWILTSSSGAVDASLRPGDAVMLADHVNCSGKVPSGPCGRAAASVYSSDLLEISAVAARKTGAPVRRGTFVCASGPSYETSAEILAMRERGVSTVSMSTVPEALLLASMGCDVAGVSMVTNAAEPGATVTHEEVLSVQELVRERQQRFLMVFLEGASARELP